MRASLIAAILLITAFPLIAQESPSPKPSGEAMQKVLHEIRLKVLATPPSKIGRAPSEEYPHVDTIIMDWPVQDTIMSVMGSSGGDASIYTSGSFGLLGGGKYENVRNAAKKFVKVAEKYYLEATPTEDFHYPQAGHVRFYFICYDGVRLIDTDITSLSTGKSKYSDLFAEGQKVIGELRLVAQSQPKETH
jgi:hypothetical protein